MFQDGIKEMDESRQGEVLNRENEVKNPLSRKLFLESYGCAMNFSDSEIIASILGKEGFETTTSTEDADIIFLNTCAIREGAETRIWDRLKSFRQTKRKNPDLIVGVLGCMAERLKTRLLEQEKLVDIVAGPDSYRDLPNLIASVEGGQKAVNVLLSREETYADISPVRLSTNGVSAFISITRGCDNMCSFCVVPFTRGRERSRDPESIVNEARQLFENGYREVTLLGQNVDSYLWHPETNTKKEILKLEEDGEKRRQGEMENVSPAHPISPSPFLSLEGAVTFANLLEMVAGISPLLRVRFSTSNPRDITEDVLFAMKKHDNICKYIHLPVQSGNSRILEKMNRGYSREDYLKWVERIKNILPGVGISTDIITGFCSETEEEHRDTLSLMETAGFEYAYMFQYSERPGTPAAKNFPDDVPAEIKSRRLTEIMDLQKKLSMISNQADVNKVHRVLVENHSKRSSEHLSGRNDQNKIVIFPKENYKKGDYVDVLVTECSSATLMGKSILR